jgi:hypothetical protein
MARGACGGGKIILTNDENHKWSIGKEDPKAAAEREKRRKEFLDKYK